MLFWKPKNNQMPNHPPGGISKADAVQQTGSDVFTALNSLQNTKTISQQSNQNSQTTTQAQQDIATTVAADNSWEQILQQVTMGQGTYSGTGSFICSGVGCDGGNSNLTLSLDIDFGARTVGSANSTLSLVTGTDSTNSDSASIPTTSFASLHGPAVLKRDRRHFGLLLRHHDFTAQQRRRGGRAGPSESLLQQFHQHLLRLWKHHGVALDHAANGPAPV